MIDKEWFMDFFDAWQGFFIFTIIVFCLCFQRFVVAYLYRDR